MEKLLKDKVVFITGAAGVIGGATATACLEEGAFVVLADRDENRLKDLTDTLVSKFGTRSFSLKFDLKDLDSVKSAVSQALSHFGRIDCLICNAATFAFNRLEDWSNLDSLDNHYAVGLRGHTALIRQSWIQFPQSKSGSIVNISSVAGHIGEPNAFAYTPIKAALKGLTLSCAIDMAAAGGWAVTLSPGHTWSVPHEQRARAEGLTRKQYEDTKPNIQSTMFGKFLDPIDVGRWVTLLASPMGKPLTGQDVHLSNGIEAGGFNRSYRTAVPSAD